MTIIAFCSAVLLVIIHLLASKLKFLQVIPRSRWLSFSSGISVAYIFVHLLPELKEWQERVEQAVGFLSHHLYLVALCGLIVFYGLERAVKISKSGQQEASSKGVFWIHILSFTLYNCLIGYLLVQSEEESIWSGSIFTLAMGAHFLVNDYGLYHHHRHLYIHSGRWLVSGGIAVGFLTGWFTEIQPLILAIGFAMLAGGVILNVLKEELPEERKSRFLPFLIGALLYALILLAR